MAQDDDDLLYGDLEDTGRSADFTRLTEKIAELTQKNDSLTTELNETKQQLTLLVNEKAVVERNMTVLYNTALREVERKDKQIAQLLLQTASNKRANTGPALPTGMSDT